MAKSLTQLILSRKSDNFCVPKTLNLKSGTTYKIRKFHKYIESRSVGLEVPL